MKQIWSRRHDPWIMVWPLALAQMISWGCIFYAFSLFVTPLIADLGWTRQALNGALSLAFLTMAATAYPVGRWIDHNGGRGIMVVGCIAAGGLLIAASRVTEPIEFYLLWSCLGVCMACILYEPAFIVITQVFGFGAKRGIAAVTLLAGFSSTLFIPLIEFLLARYGWQDTYIILGLILLFLAAPLQWLFIPPKTIATQHDTALDQQRRGGFSLLKLCRRPVFWGLVIWAAGNSFMITGVLFQLVPLLKSAGVSVRDVVLCMTVFGPLQVLGRIAVMLFAHRIGTATLGTLTTIVFPLGVLVLLVAPYELVWLCLAVALIGAANGIATIVRGTAPAEWIGLTHYGKVAGAITVPVLIAGALSPSALAWVWQHHGAPAMLATILCAGLISAGGYAFARAYRDNY